MAFIKEVDAAASAGTKGHLNLVENTQRLTGSNLLFFLLLLFFQAAQRQPSPAERPRVPRQAARHWPLWLDCPHPPPHCPPRAGAEVSDWPSLVNCNQQMAVANSIKHIQRKLAAVQCAASTNF